MRQQAGHLDTLQSKDKQINTNVFHRQKKKSYAKINNLNCSPQAIAIAITVSLLT